MSVDRLKFTFLILFILFFSQNYLLRFCSFRCWTQQRIQVNINRPSKKKRSKQRQFIIIIYSWWSFFLILIPSTDLWKAELTDRMTEQTQNSWNGDFPTSTIASVIENRFCFFFKLPPIWIMIHVVTLVPYSHLCMSGLTGRCGSGDSTVLPRTKRVLLNLDVLCSFWGTVIEYWSRFFFLRLAIVYKIRKTNLYRNTCKNGRIK